MAGEITDGLVTRIRDKAGDNTASFTAARIVQWMNDAQDRIMFLAIDLGLTARPTNPAELVVERIPELLKQLSATTDSDGTYAIPSDFLYRWRLLYGASNIEAPYRNPRQIAIALADSSWGTYAAVGPVYTFTTAGKFKVYPTGAIAVKFEYVKRPTLMEASVTDPDMPARFHEALVNFAAEMCRTRQTDMEGKQAFQADFDRAVGVLLGSGQT